MDCDVDVAVVPRFAFCEAAFSKSCSCWMMAGSDRYTWLRFLKTDQRERDSLVSSSSKGAGESGMSRSIGFPLLFEKPEFLKCVAPSMPR